MRHLKANTFFYVFCTVLILLSMNLVSMPVSADTDTPIPVFVSIEPQVPFVEKIGAERVRVEALVLPGESPATYSPKPAQMARLAKSKLFFRIGVPFEEQLIQRIQTVGKQVRIIDTRKGIELRKMEMHVEGSPESHDHDAAHVHENNGYDPHIWLNPLLVKKQAATIREALIAVDPEGKKAYEINYDALIKELDALDYKIRKSLGPVKGKTIFVFHPSFGYFTDAYGLKQIAVETGGKSPKGKDLSRFIKLAKNEKVRVVFVQPQFDQNAAKKIANAIGGVVIPIDPLSREYFKNMEFIADTIGSALKK